MQRKNRYQAAILHEGKLLLIQHREHESGRAYWLIPGGGREEGESEEETVRREAREETNLDVRVEGLLLDDPNPIKNATYYQRFKTYLCTPLTLNAAPGYEPEPEVAAFYAIAAVKWVTLADESTWGEDVLSDYITASLLRRVREAVEKGMR